MSFDSARDERDLERGLFRRIYDTRYYRIFTGTSLWTIRIRCTVPVWSGWGGQRSRKNRLPDDLDVATRLSIMAGVDFLSRFGFLLPLR